MYANDVQKLKELVDLSSFCNLQHFESLTKELQAIKNWISREFFKENLPETIRYMGLKVSDITEIDMLFQYSEVLFY